RMLLWVLLKLYDMIVETFQAQTEYSIDCVFRNEAVNETHLAELHEVEGIYWS
nr:phenylalanine--tRNA ligase alpha subunit, cytoplasmic-like [Tanacetum cinerariifolium]